MVTIEITLPSGKTERHTIGDVAVSIGRMLGQVRIHDPGVSALHGQITVEDGEVCYRDLGSAQGSFLPDGTPIRYTVPLQCGDRVRLGDHHLALIEFADPAQGEAAKAASPAVDRAKPTPAAASQDTKHASVPAQDASPSATDPESQAARATSSPTRPESERAGAFPSERAPGPAPAGAATGAPSSPSRQAFATLSNKEAVSSLRRARQKTGAPKQRSVSQGSGRASKVEALRRISNQRSSTSPPQAKLALREQAQAPAKPKLQKLSPNPIRFAGRERTAPRIEPSTWKDAASGPPKLAHSRALAKGQLGPLLGSGPLFVGVLVLVALIAPLFWTLGLPFFALLFVVVFALTVRALMTWTLSVTELISEDTLHPRQNWKRARNLGFATALNLTLAVLVCLPLLFPLCLAATFLLPATILEQRKGKDALARSWKLWRLHLARLAGPCMAWLAFVLICVGIPIAAVIWLPGLWAIAAAAPLAALAVIGMTWAGMVTSVHAFRVYFWARAQEDPSAPQLRPALLLPPA